MYVSATISKAKPHKKCIHISHNERKKTKHAHDPPKHLFMEKKVSERARSSAVAHSNSDNVKSSRFILNVHICDQLDNIHRVCVFISMSVSA